MKKTHLIIFLNVTFLVVFFCVVFWFFGVFFVCFFVFFLNGLSRQSTSEDNKSVALCVIKYL